MWRLSVVCEGRQVPNAIPFDRSQTGDEHPYLSYSVVIDGFECEWRVDILMQCELGKVSKRLVRTV
jgi:hypothetical protein